MLRTPPDVLITTPESLYLMLTSKAREFLVDTEAVIVDEIHAVARTKRGAHLALTLERLEHLAGRRLQRIGLSATQRPLEEVGRFLVGGGRECRIVDAGIRKPLDLKIHVPVDNMREPDAGPSELGHLSGGESTQRSIWPAIYPELLELIRAHRSTIVFVNNRRGAERLAVRLNELAEEDSQDTEPAAAIARAHHGSLAREERLVVEDLLKSGELPCLVATSLARARHRHGSGRPRDPGGVAQVGHRGPAAHRPRRPRRGRGLARAHLPQVPRRSARVRCRRQAHARRRHRGDRRAAQPARRPRPADRGDDRDRGRVEGARAARGGAPRLPVRRAIARAARFRARHARRALPLRGVRRAAPAHRLGPRGGHRALAQGRAAAGGHQRRHDPRPRPLRRPPA